jgi:PHD/YefM family antitoxin component YafN of YafNO toxin-antitoxin module
MAKVERRISYEDFVARLPELLDELDRDHKTVFIEKNGRAFLIGPAEELRLAGLPPLPPWRCV